MAPSQRELCSHPGVKPLSESRFCELPVAMAKFLASPGNLVTYASLADLGRRLCRGVLGVWSLSFTQFSSRSILSGQERSLWPGPQALPDSLQHRLGAC